MAYPSQITEIINSSLVGDHTLLAIGVCTEDNWTLIEGNKALASFLGVNTENMQGRPLQELLAEQGLEYIFRPLTRLRENALGLCQMGSGQLLLKWQWQVTSASMVTPQHSQRAPRQRLFFALELDTGLLESGNAATVRELNALFDSLQEGVWVIDAEGITLRVNKAVERMTGLTAAELVGKPVSTPMQEGKYSSCVTLRALTEKRAVTMFDDYANGKRFLNTSTPVLDDAGNVWRVIGVLWDMSRLEALQEKLNKLERANRQYQRRLQRLEQEEFSDLLGSSPGQRHFLRELSKVAKVDVAALILGETGTGKTVAAQAIHKASSRGDGPFVTINCGAIPPALMESELFGYEQGAFTGAQKAGKTGLIEAAQGGTIFFDEIGELPLNLQVKLLHVLDGQPFLKIGGLKPIHLEARVLAATNKPLDIMVQEGAFREDLYYRLHVLTLTLPPLRSRVSDIPELAEHFLALANEKNRMSKVFSPRVLAYFCQYAWPGNVRELRSTVEYMAAMAEKSIISVRDLPTRMGAEAIMPPAEPDMEQGFRAMVAEFERNILARALAETGSTWKAAKKLKISQSTVARKATRYKIGIAEVVHPF